MPSRAPRTLPKRELDDYHQFGARIGASYHTVWRMVKGGLPAISVGGMRRIDPVVGMAYLRGELPPPEPPRRGRPRKRDSATASATAAAGTPRRPKLRLHHRTRESL
jgi:hypothetical protein